MRAAFIVGCALGLLPVSATLAREPDAASALNVVLVANSSYPDSLVVARHYARARGVPEANLFAFPMPLQETVTWPEFVNSIWQPVQDALISRGWIVGTEMDSKDAVGRRHAAITSHHIEALILCRGVPLRVADDPELSLPNRPMTDVPEFRTNAGSVDSELSLLAESGGYPIEAYVPNPLFGNDRPGPFDRFPVVKVARLDGPTAGDAMALVDRAMAAERTGLIGRAYIDMAGVYADGNQWLQTTAFEIRKLGFDTSVQRDAFTLQDNARFDAPVLYFGWHTPDLNGPFALPGFRFPTGSIAFHMHSFSARTVRSATEAWCGPLVARGVTATMGNVFEPYLQLTHRPDLFFMALARGDSLADAAYFSLPALSWQAVLIGDPLYHPFKVGLPEQLRRLDELPPGLAGYPVLRMMHLLDSTSGPDRALGAGFSAMRERPSLALAVGLAERLEKEGRRGEVAGLLLSQALWGPLASDQWVLEREAARHLVEDGHPEDAVEVYRRLLAIPSLPIDMRARWLDEASNAALAAGFSDQAATWKAAMDQAVKEMIGK